ncbi:AMP-binding protein [Acinetobacter sp. ANC 3882]|uniref:AMP-binding protein n=1 Tax=Acinetobacter sp. ANC 3882 TaxID=2923423 RepID=UPI001F4AF9E3|nr:AMP-binding protein [Acinetobacter sp. ANC 3882]MCH7313082.1 AMP-binding protein [Acinetobacter sp. ANC 3882]
MKKFYPWLQTYQNHVIPAEITLPPEDQSLSDLLDISLQKHSVQTAFICGEKSITFQDLNNLSLRFSNYLLSLGLVPQTRVAVMLPNCLQYPVVALGIIRAGHVVVNVNPLYTSRELAHQLNDSQSEVLVIIDDFLSTFTAIQNNVPVQKVVHTSLTDLNCEIDLLLKQAESSNGISANSINFTDALCSVSDDSYILPKLNLNSLASLQYTGGTTGVSKGAILSHKNLYSNIIQIDAVFSYQLDVLNNNIQHKNLCTLPLYHIFGFTVCCLFGISKGITTILITNPKDLNFLVQSWVQHQPSMFPAVNTMFNVLLNFPDFNNLDFNSLKISIGGGMPVLKATADEWQEKTGVVIHEAYGLSETSPLAVFNPLTTKSFSGKIGIPAPSTDVVILDEHGNNCSFGNAGEIAIKGPQVMQGYWNREEETRKVMTDDGYFLSGDIGVMDKDGYIELVDRKKDMIIVSGFNVYPREIEEIIATHPKVLEVAVIGVKDEKSGEVPKAFIVVKDTTLIIAEIQDFIHQKLTKYKCPKYVEFITELPKSNIGKILKKNLVANN